MYGSTLIILSKSMSAWVRLVKKMSLYNPFMTWNFFRKKTPSSTHYFVFPQTELLQLPQAPPPPPPPPPPPSLLTSITRPFRKRNRTKSVPNIHKLSNNGNLHNPKLLDLWPSMPSLFFFSLRCNKLVFMYQLGIYMKETNQLYILKDLSTKEYYLIYSPYSILYNI